MASATKGVYASNVFVNCPFDDAYNPLFKAIIFTIHECGFFARCALERTDASELRVKKIYDLIDSSKYGVHDLSRVELDKTTDLPRFNMPLELGIFLGAKFLGTAKQREKNCLVFDEHPYRYQMYLSDIAGQDIVSHHNEVPKVISSVRNWLAHEVEQSLPGGKAIEVRLERFQRELVGICSSNGQTLEELSYRDFVRYVTEFTSCKVDRLECGQKTRWGNPLSNPSLAHIREALKALKGGSNSFAHLRKAGTGSSYMQVHGSKEDGYILEYQDGAPGKHFRSTTKVTEIQLIKAFQQFRSGSPEWLTSIEWQSHEWWAAEDG